VVAGVRALGVGDRLEETRHVGVPLLARHGGEGEVLLRRLALAGERRLEFRGSCAELLGLRGLLDERGFHGRALLLSTAAAVWGPSSTRVRGLLA
jgi:hypothetical protein